DAIFPALNSQLVVAHQSLYRKYRSQTFDDLIGQDHVVRTLQNAISSGRIGHAYLFTGPRGTGKTSTARLLAKALCATDGPTATPSDDDPICKAIAEGNFVDVVEMDAASESGVDDIREQIVEVAEYRPMIARYKVFIIDEVHDLSSKAFDALLKTIEEPPEHLIFILATTEYNKVPPTIRSRCQKYEFHRASMADLTDRLNYVLKHEGIEADPAAIAAISRMADGGYRDALTLLEQAILTTEEGRITLNQVYDQLGLVPEETIDRLLLSIRAADIVGIMETLGEIARLGRDPRSVLDSMMQRMSDLTRAAYQVPTGASDGAREASLYETAQRLGRDYLLRLRGQIAEAHKTLRDITLPRLWLEAELIRLATPSVPVVAPVAVSAAVAPIAPPTPVAEPIRRRVMPDEAPPTPTAAEPIPAETPIEPETPAAVSEE
ncbi:DNA polymerase III subunit gamma/tau, partial [bacterium]